MSREQKRNTLRNWEKRRNERGYVVTADELIGRIRRNWPTTSPEDVEWLYQECG